VHRRYAARTGDVRAHILTGGAIKDAKNQEVTVDLGSPVPYLLFLHVMGAIIAFGPPYAFTIMGRMAGSEPQHANFSVRQVYAISRAQVWPLAIVQGVTGVLLVIATGIRVEKQAWLLVAIVLYLIALVFSLTVQRTNTSRLIALTSAPPPAGAPPGPPPEVAATVRRIQRGGIFTGLLVLVIVFLMVAKPGLG